MRDEKKELKREHIERFRPSFILFRPRTYIALSHCIIISFTTA